MGNNAASIIKTICPELADSPSLGDFLGMAIELTNRSFFGKLAPYAIAYRACHLFMVSGGSVSGGIDEAVSGLGQISGMSEGGLSVSLAASAISDSGGLDTTKYGKLLLGLIKSRPTMGVNTAGLHCSLPGGYR
jgi:hypothetical protein